MKYNIRILKQFDGKYNYFNCTGLNDKILYRRQRKYKNKLLVSDIVDETDNIILESYESDHSIISYEDPRFINNDEISMCVCTIDKSDLTKIINVSYKIYNMNTKTFLNFKTQHSHFEKNWQFIDDKILYHIDPYVILDTEENIMYSRKLDFKKWVHMYGCPRLSTNMFTVDGSYYLLFHSNTINNIKDNTHFQYYTGLMEITSDFIPVGYYMTPIIKSSDTGINKELLERMRKWRNEIDSHTSVYYDVIFPLNVEVLEKIKIYCGIDDCSAGYIEIEKVEFQKFLETNDMIKL